MNKQKILIAVFAGLGAVLLSLVVVFFFMREIKPPAIPAPPVAMPADPPLSEVISRCEAALDEFIQGEGNPPQRVCEVEGGVIKVYSTDADLDSQINPEDVIVISLNLPGILARDPLINVFTGEVVARPTGQTRLCFVTYPVLMEQNMQGHPNFDKDAYALFYEHRRWSYHPSAVFDAEIEGRNFICSNPLHIGEFPKVSFEIRIPPREILALDEKALGTRAYGVKIVAIPDRFIQGFNNVDKFSINHGSFPPIYFLGRPIYER